MANHLRLALVENKGLCLPPRRWRSGSYVWMKKWIMEEEHMSPPSLSSISPNRLSGTRMHADIGRFDPLPPTRGGVAGEECPCFVHLTVEVTSLDMSFPISCLPSILSACPQVTCSFLKICYQYLGRLTHFLFLSFITFPSQMLPVFQYCV